ncbi:MAG: hypothetical protein AAGD05_19475, partial [Bacteroidota bacterium]
MMKMKNYSTLFLLMTLLLACNQEQLGNQNAMSGVWRSIGSGKIMHIQNDQYQWYDITTMSCLPVRSASIQEFGDALQLQNDTLSIKIGVITYKYLKIDQLPDWCQQEIPTAEKQSPLYNFEVFANTAKEHYAFFE